jgi:hypothetical protein
MRDLLIYLDARFGESATWASIAAMLVAAHVSIDPGLWHTITMWGTLGAGALAVVLREAGNKPPQTIASDLLSTIGAAAVATAGDDAPKPAPAPAPAHAPTPAAAGSIASALGMVLLVPVLLLASLSACSNTSVSAVANDVALIDSGLGTTLKALNVTLPPQATTALADITAAASAIGSADTTAAAQPIVQRVATDVLAVAQAVLPLVPGGSAAYVAIEAAEVLVPAIETAVGLATNVGAAPGGMTPDQARLILRSAASK